MVQKKFTIEPETDDDTAFVTTINPILEQMSEFQPEQVYVIKIDKWFDAKWAAFSGKALGALGVWKGRLTLPPFHPHRVQWQHSLVRCANGYVPGDAKPLHIEQQSSHNLNRNFDAISSSGLLIWYS